MELTTENIYMLWICIAAIFFLFFNPLIKIAARIFLRTTIGLAAIYFFNIILCMVDDTKKFCIGINLLTITSAIILGLPGIILSYLVHITL